MAIEFVGSSFSTDNHTLTGNTYLFTPAPAGLQEGDFCVAVWMQNAGATGTGSNIAHNIPYDASDVVLSDYVEVEADPNRFFGTNSGGEVLPLVAFQGVTLGPTIPDHWRAHYRDPVVTNDRNLIGFVLAFRNFTVDPANAYGGDQAGAAVGPTAGDVTPTLGAARVSADTTLSRIYVTAYWTTWATSANVIALGTPPGVDTFVDEIGRVITSPVVARRSIAGAYSLLEANDADLGDDSVVWNQTDQASVRGRGISIIYQGTSVAAAPILPDVPASGLRWKVTHLPYELTRTMTRP